MANPDNTDKEIGLMVKLIITFAIAAEVCLVVWLLMRDEPLSRVLF